MSCNFSVLCRQHTSYMGFCSVDWLFLTSGSSCVRHVMAYLSVESSYKRELCIRIVHTHLSVIIPASHQHSEPVLRTQTSMDFEATPLMRLPGIMSTVGEFTGIAITSYNNGRMLAQVYASGTELLAALTAF